MPYTLPNWQDSPSTATPISAANLTQANTAINSIDSRLTTAEAGKLSSGLVNAKGKLISADNTGTPTALLVGANGQVLTADNTTTTGLKWATPATGGSGSKHVITDDATYFTPRTNLSFLNALVGSADPPVFITDDASFDGTIVSFNVVDPRSIDAKGDLLAGTGNNTLGRVPTGTIDGQVLTRSAAASTGIAWAAPGAISTYLTVSPQFNGTFVIPPGGGAYLCTMTQTNTICMMDQSTDSPAVTYVCVKQDTVGNWQVGWRPGTIAWEDGAPPNLLAANSANGLHFFKFTWMGLSRGYYGEWLGGIGPYTVPTPTTWNSQTVHIPGVRVRNSSNTTANASMDTLTTLFGASWRQRMAGIGLSFELGVFSPTDGPVGAQFRGPYESAEGFYLGGGSKTMCAGGSSSYKLWGHELGHAEDDTYFTAALPPPGISYVGHEQLNKHPVIIAVWVDCVAGTGVSPGVQLTAIGEWIANMLLARRATSIQPNTSDNTNPQINDVNANRTHLNYNIGPGSGVLGINEVQRFTINNWTSLSSGTYTLGFIGQTTSTLQWNSSDGQIQSALEALSTIGSGNVSVVTEGFSDKTWNINFKNSRGSADQPLITVSSTLSASISEQIKGAAATDRGTPQQRHDRFMTYCNTTLGMLI